MAQSRTVLKAATDYDTNRVTGAETHLDVCYSNVKKAGKKKINDQKSKKNYLPLEIINCEDLSPLQKICHILRSKKIPAII